MSNNIVLIQFSSREAGNCAAIAGCIRQYFTNDMVSDFTVTRDVVAPCGNCDYECLKNDETCPNLTGHQIKLYNAICNADFVYYIIPNYCGYPCANYFAFNERSVGYFNMDRTLMEKYMSVKKAFIVVSNTEGQNFVNALAQQAENPEILYLKSSKYGKRSVTGDLMESQDARHDLLAYLERHRP